MIQWKDYREDETLVSKRKIWESKCGKYKVVYSHLIVGEGVTPDRYYAIGIDEKGSEFIINIHYKEKPAFQSCEKHRKERKRNAQKNN